MKRIFIYAGSAILFIHFSHSSLSAVSKSSATAKGKLNHTGHLHRQQYQILLNKGLLRPQKETYKYNEPADLINLVPILRDINEMIPRQFALAEHEFLLDPSHITIRHEWMDSRIRKAPKSSIISLSYSSPGTNYFGSRLDVPLFYSSRFGLSEWSRYPLGNYTWTLDRTNSFSQERIVYIRALARFSTFREIFLFEQPKE